MKSIQSLSSYHSYSDIIQRMHIHTYIHTYIHLIEYVADHGTFMLLGFMTTNKLAKVAKQMGVEMVFVAGDLSYAGIDADMPRANITSADEVRNIHRK